MKRKIKMGKKEDDASSKRSQPRRWIACQTEDDYIGSLRKEQRQDRKRAIAKDRSKYKKTDLKKESHTPVIKPGLTIGRVIAIISQGIIVAVGDKEVRCQLRGVLKKERTRMKNLIVVGDIVHFERAGKDEGIIHAIDPRKSVLARADNLSREREQLIAANIDQVFITVSVINPILRSAIVDRYIIAATTGHMHPVILVNKIDLFELGEGTEEDQEYYQEFLKAYAKAGVQVIPTSIHTGEGIDQVREIMKNKASVFAGQSGVGKSSLINAITGYDLRTRETVSRTKKGAHTTTQAQLLRLDFGGWCIDTPGIRSFGLFELQRDEIEHYFSEIHEIGLGCKFSDCAHTHEEKCEVKSAVEEGEISELRYDSYCQLLAEVDERHRRR